VKVKKAETPVTTGQQLASIIKACRDIMRKDKGLNGDLDRLPMLTWIMFLKFLDDMEKIHETEAQLKGKTFVPAIEPPYRWRDWAEKSDGITGDDLIAFVNQDEAMRPDNTKGKGLFKYLKSLQGENGGDRRDVIATVFRGTVNRMINGYLLRDVVNKINGIHFTSSEEIHTLSHLYESMLKEMRDAAGDSGEFYTPRPVIQFIVSVIDPKIGETILDPACGTGGFLVETFEHLKQQEKTTKDHERIQKGSIFGGEAKSLPYLLAQMNLLLHGLEYPKIDSGNSLRFPLREIGDSERVDVIVTNPPFGGEEEKGILGNFPEDKQTAETALLFLQLIMRKLKRKGSGKHGGRCGIVVHNGTLSNPGIAIKVREDLLRDFNLHTIVRLPKGVFSPYADIETNLLFFEHSGSTKEIWFYQVPLPVGRNQYTKTKPMKFEEFEPVLAWWKNRTENSQAWKISLEFLIANDFNLDIKNPNAPIDEEICNPKEIVTNLIEKKSIQDTLFNSIQHELKEIETIRHAITNVKLEKVLHQRSNFIKIDDLKTYKRVTAQLHAKGIILRDEIEGMRIRTKKQQICKTDDFLVAEIDAKMGGFGIVPLNLEGSIVSSHYYLFEIDKALLDIRFLIYYIKTKTFQSQIIARGSTNYAAVRSSDILQLEIPLPPLEKQKRIISRLEKIEALHKLLEETNHDLEFLTSSILTHVLRKQM
jgi:type I restriction enzyme M protein